MSCDKDSCKSVLNKVFDCVNSGISWRISHIKSACPPKKKKTVTDENKKSCDESIGGVDPDYKRKKSYITPSQICPSTKRCCVIKMQDPCAPCCCEDIKPKLPPCPPKRRHCEPREPICGCDLCQKKGGNDKCCDRNRAFRGITLDPRYFEKA
ncbi:uncharacterized protein LOC143185077 [Calliopsis andreniformis]|uniref:uncharacterized protein LOC143185077 n=1 Tax=Calliopsis andreniformis TaxID=337506 RepID=UPI003FCCB28E